jgi:hypothetical protein
VTAATVDHRNGAERRQNARLTPKQEAVALLLAAGKSVAEAASECGAGKRTVMEWLSSCPAMRRRVAEVRAELSAQALGKLSAAATKAAETLAELLADDSGRTRLGAARAIIDGVLKMREQQDLADRLDAIEQRLAQRERR